MTARGHTFVILHLDNATLGIRHCYETSLCITEIRHVTEKSPLCVTSFKSNRKLASRFQSVVFKNTLVTYYLMELIVNENYELNIAHWEKVRHEDGPLLLGAELTLEPE